jgi:hypothetical protein
MLLLAKQAYRVAPDGALEEGIDQKVSALCSGGKRMAGTEPARRNSSLVIVRARRRQVPINTEILLDVR